MGYAIDREKSSFRLLEKWPNDRNVIKAEAEIAKKTNLIDFSSLEDPSKVRFPGGPRSEEEENANLDGRPEPPTDTSPDERDDAEFVKGSDPSLIPEEDRLLMADGFVLPAKDTITKTIATLAKKDAGKTYTGLVMAEEMVRLKLPFVVLDPTGVWWGLRSGADGLSGGCDVLVVGGDYGDFELLPSDGARMAMLVVERWRKPTVIDLSLLSPEEQHIFVAAFGSKLYAINRRPVHLFIDEADEFAPQKPESPLQKTVLAVIDRIVRRGRRRGIGCSMFTQRSAVLNKNVLSQVDMLIAMLAVSPADLDAIHAWISRAVPRSLCDECLRELPKLPQGGAYIVSSGKVSIFRRVQIRRRETFDSSKTPGFDDALIADPILIVPSGLEETSKFLDRKVSVLKRAELNLEEEPPLEHPQQDPPSPEEAALQEEFSPDSNESPPVESDLQHEHEYDDENDVPDFKD